MQKGGSVLSTLLLLVAPRLFPALTDPDKKAAALNPFTANLQ